MVSNIFSLECLNNVMTSYRRINRSSWTSSGCTVCYAEKCVFSNGFGIFNKLPKSTSNIEIHVQCVIQLCSIDVLYYFLLKGKGGEGGGGCRTRVLSSEFKTEQAKFTEWLCPSYHLTTWRKSVRIQKPSAQIPKAFYQHGIAEKTKVI